MSGPSSTRIAIADSRLTPGMVFEEPDQCLERRQGRFDALVGLVDPVGVEVELLQKIGEHPAAVLVELEAQRVVERLELLAHMLGHRRENALPRLARNYGASIRMTIHPSRLTRRR